MRCKMAAAAVFSQSIGSVRRGAVAMNAQNSLGLLALLALAVYCGTYKYLDGAPTYYTGNLTVPLTMPRRPGSRAHAWDMRTVYVITPTYARATQQADMTRVSQSLQLAASRGSVHWVVVEDSTAPAAWLGQLLMRSGLPYTHLNINGTVHVRNSPGKLCRGMVQRNLALTWLRDHVTNTTAAVLYFGDDDNSYNSHLFDEVRSTQGVSLLPTGGFTGVSVSTPIVIDGVIKALKDPWTGRRAFPIDMASLGVNVQQWLRQGAPLFTCTNLGMMETNFVEALKVKLKDIEPKAQNCTRVLVWHTRTSQPKQNCKQAKNFRRLYPESNIDALLTSVGC